MTKPKICLVANELADAYALSTLYNFLEEINFPAKFSFCYKKFDSATKHVIEDLDYHDFLYHRGLQPLIVQGYSDISGKLVSKGQVSIDLAVLKSCAIPISEERRERLSKPVIVVGYSNCANDDHIRKIASQLCGDAKIFFIGGVWDFWVKKLAEKGEVGIINEFGVLKNYYAIADVAIFGSNLIRNFAHLHNFVEATEKSPLFLLTPINQSQYGYKQLRDVGVVREFDSLDKLILGVKSYLANPNSEEVRRARQEHIMQTRVKYLPDIARFLGKILGINQEPLTSDLLVKIEDNGAKVFNIETAWEDIETNDSGVFPISEVPESFYQNWKEQVGNRKGLLRRILGSLS